MKLLLDTQLLLWAAGFPGRLSRRAQALIEDADTILFFSAASIWEASIKSGMGRADFQLDTRVLRRALLDNGYTELPVRSEHAVRLLSLPSIHRDPFDRILVAQATHEGITLITTDTLVARYPGPVMAV